MWCAGPYVVVDQVARRFELRDGKDVDRKSSPLCRTCGRGADEGPETHRSAPGQETGTVSLWGDAAGPGGRANGAGHKRLSPLSAFSSALAVALFLSTDARADTGGSFVGYAGVPSVCRLHGRRRRFESSPSRVRRCRPFNAGRGPRRPAPLCLSPRRRMTQPNGCMRRPWWSICKTNALPVRIQWRPGQVRCSAGGVNTPAVPASRRRRARRDAAGLLAPLARDEPGSVPTSNSRRTPPRIRPRLRWRRNGAIWHHDHARGDDRRPLLETAINSDLPGYTRAVVSRDVRGFDGKIVLIPARQPIDRPISQRLVAGPVACLHHLDAGHPSRRRYRADRLAGRRRAGPRRLDRRSQHATSLPALAAPFCCRSSMPVACGCRGTPSTQIGIGSPAAALGRRGQRVIPTGENIFPTIRSIRARTITIFVARDLDFSLVKPVQ